MMSERPATFKRPPQAMELVRALEHDLRNPVGNILGYVDLLRSAEGPPLSEEQHEFLSRIEENCTVVLRLLDQLARRAAEPAKPK